MSQPTPYNIQTSFNQDEVNGAGGRSTIKTASLDTELNNLKTTIDGILANLALIQRDDGKIKDGLGEPHIFNLSASLEGFLKWTGSAWNYVPDPTIPAQSAQAAAEVAQTAAETAKDLALTYKNDANTAKIAAEVAKAAAEVAAQAISTVAAIQQGSYWYGVTGGSANAYTLDLSPTPSVNPKFLFIKVHEANTLASTINVNGIGVVNIKKHDGTDLSPGDLPLNGMMILIYDGSNYVISGATTSNKSMQIKRNSKKVANLQAASGISDGPLDLFNNELYTDNTSTKTTSESTSGQKYVVVASVTGLAVGMSVDLIHATDKTKSEIAKISSINSLTLTMESDLTNTYPIGSPVKRDGLLMSVGKKKLPFASLEGAGDGRDGSVLITSGGTISFSTAILGSLRKFYPDSIERVVIANPTGTTINIASQDEAGFETGDLVLLMNKQGTPGDSADAGNFEILSVASLDDGVINVAKTISNSYGGITFANQKITVQRVPQYTTVTLNHASAKLSCAGWDGTKGGTLIFACKESLNLTSGEIYVKGLGYRGGVRNGHLYPGAGEGEQGKSDGPSSTIPYTSANGSGGGAVLQNSFGGAGGGHGTAGENTSVSTGGNMLGNTNLTKMYFGGGGGAGYTSTSEERGRDGGGIIYILAETMNTNGIIDASGDAVAPYYNYSGGGGAGGTIFLKTKTLSFGSSNRILATGGPRSGVTYPGTAGGEGRVRIEYTTIDGHSHPNSTEENDATNPTPGSTTLAVLNTGSLAARHRSILTSKPQRDIESMDLWTRCSITTSHTSTSGTTAAFIIIGITAGEQSKYGVGNTILIKLPTGKYLENPDGTPYNPKVNNNSLSGEITVDSQIPTTFSGATLQRLDSIPRASIVPIGTNENMGPMDLQFVEETNVTNEIETEWFLDKKGSEGQDITIEIGLSVEDENQQENTYCEQYTTNLNYA